MPTVKNLRHERFAQAMTGAVDTASADPSAGHDLEGGAAEARASRLQKKAVVAVRIAEPQAMPATAVSTMELTTTQAICEFEQARQLALKKGQASAAVSATMAKAKLAGLLTGKPENKPARVTGFDGNYTEAARRISLLLRLAANETSDGHKR